MHKATLTHSEQTPRRWRKWVVAPAVAVAVILLLQTVRVILMPDLDPWHTERLVHEFHADDEHDGWSFADYLAAEDRLFRELDERVVAQVVSGPDGAWNRYSPGGQNNPVGFATNWNRSYVMVPDKVRGGALLLHGLTDSPYSLRRQAEVLFDRGYMVVGLRLPGHGTTPAGLVSVRAEDWMAATRIAVRHLMAELGGRGPLLVVGYSNGGALAVNYALESLAKPELPVPERLILFSPAIGITRFAVFADWHRLISWAPGFSGLCWNSLMIEFDPYKYNSFPKNGGYQTHRLTKMVQSGVDRLHRSGRVDELPPILTFASLADATVKIEAVVEALYGKLEDPGSELVIFDINRRTLAAELFVGDPATRLRALREGKTLNFHLTVVGNADESSEDIVERTYAAGSTAEVVRALDLRWPRDVFSLSRVAVPFPADDPLYGRPADQEARHEISLGTFEPRGERRLLRVPVEHFMRLRANPFFAYVEERMIQAADRP